MKLNKEYIRKFPGFHVLTRIIWFYGFILGFNLVCVYRYRTIESFFSVVCILLAVLLTFFVFYSYSGRQWIKLLMPTLLVYSFIAPIGQNFYAESRYKYRYRILFKSSMHVSFIISVYFVAKYIDPINKNLWIVASVLCACAGYGIDIKNLAPKNEDVFKKYNR